MATATVNARPNIRIEIQNNLVEPMEVDENDPQETEFEDGEIKDDTSKNNAVVESNAPRTWNNKEGGFATGIDIFNEKEHEKLQERANRFGLNPDEICNFTNDDLQKLHNSLGISGNNEKDVRFEAIHIRGTEEMSTEDVFEYFANYGPTCIEWIDDESCNIVWEDKLSAARALHFTSKAVKGMPIDGPCDPFTKDNGDQEDECRSILLANENRVIEIAKELPDSDVNDNEVSISDISVPIPPGYWRRGVDHPKSNVLLLRFAFKTDRKPLKAERFSEYYKKYGNPNFGYLKGVISASCRNKFRGIFDRNKDIKKAAITDSKNPWGDLAESWDQDEQFSEQAYINETQPPPKSPSNSKPSVAKEVLKRLGAKRPHIEQPGIGAEEVVKKVSKVPRMRMYADEEEVKIKRKKQLQQLKQQQSDVAHTTDLRNMIGNNKSKADKTEPSFENDLGAKLKNRKHKEDEKRKKLEVTRAVGDSHSDRRLRHRSPDHVRRTRRKESTSRRSYDKSHYRNKMHSDRYERMRRRRSLSTEDLEYHKTKSKIAVVIKTQKRPTVASTVWSRITPKKERLKTASERLQSRRDSSSSSESSSADSSSSSSDSGSSYSSSDSEEAVNDNRTNNPETSSKVAMQRPGFVNPSSLTTDRKSPLRIEISNDHFKEE